MSKKAEGSGSKLPSRGPYDPTLIEEKWYGFWERNGFFATDDDSVKSPHTVMMPPPNITGRLHMGHALQSTIQDALTRLRRLQGFEALWLPGKDHAGIATQNVVERELSAKEGLSRHDLGRDAFIDRVWQWKEEYGDIISLQMRKIGVSCDWRRERFTMDDGFTRAVQHVFVALYDQGLIYRGDYLVNWCPIDRTALSDEEVDNVENDGFLWYISYPIVGESERIVIATTRPETMLGDAAVAVHPDDERYVHLVGKRVLLPLVDREIPIIADPYVKMDFGAGALKITPGHDKNDFDIGRKHGLPTINIMDVDGTINENGGIYHGFDRFDARTKIVEDLRSAGLLVKVEPYRGTVPISSRSKAVIEPLVSRQWFVRMKPLAEPALEAVRNGDVRFHPQRWENEYFRWLENIRDWTISRQLWWGHRIPVWYYTDEHGHIDESREFVVSIDQPDPGMVQDEDVLDTWFSSWLWPFATLGWPDKTKALDVFYPTQVLVSAYDILFFWIARMIMAGLHFTGKVPYTDIFITGMVKDKLGRWMSKSLGNGIDPLDMIEQYGADAVRFSLTILCAQGQDIKLDPTKFEMGRNFANKIWNAFNVFGRYMESGTNYVRTRESDETELVEQWMLHRLNVTIEAVNAATDRFRFNEALSHVYDLFWRDYCDWYLELIKPERGVEMDPDRIALAIEMFEKMTIMLHPFMPYITEELWWKLRPRQEREACIAASWPTVDQREVDVDASDTFSLIQALISGIRNVRSEYNVSPAKAVNIIVNVPDDQNLADRLNAHKQYFERLARASDVQIGTDLDKPKASASVVVGRCEAYVPLVDMIDLDVEKARLAREIEGKERFLEGVRNKLLNRQFISKAPPEVVEKEREKKRVASAELKRLIANLSDLES